MISKKTLMLALTAIGMTNAALSTGCVVVANDPNNYLSMNASVFDITGNPLAYPFDYYLNFILEDGTYSGTLVSFHQDQQTTNSFGDWSLTLANPQLFVDTGNTTCYDSCVSYDAYGCTAYATDCYSNQYTASFDTNSIRKNSATAFIGIDTGSNYVTYGSNLTVSSGMTGLNTFTQNDEFDTTILVLGGASGAASRVQGAPKAQAQVQADVTSVMSAKSKTMVAVKSLARDSKPAIIKDLSKLTAEQLSTLNKVRKALNLPARSI